jgi:hypothetical protein
MFKSCQYVLNDDKVSMGLILVSVKDAQIGLHKIITWTKKLGKGCMSGKRPALRMGCGTRS